MVILLKFKNVFVFGLVDQIFPSTRTIQESSDGIEEERRLFYVAITRAKKRLFLSNPRTCKKSWKTCILQQSLLKRSAHS